MAEPLNKIKIQAGKITALKTKAEEELKELQSKKKTIREQIKLSLKPEDLTASAHIL
jgi:protein subunit release factor A